MLFCIMAAQQAMHRADTSLLLLGSALSGRCLLEARDLRHPLVQVRVIDGSGLQ